MIAIDPNTGERIGDYAEHSPAAAAALLERAGGAFAAWRETPLAERARRLRAAAGALRARSGEHARLMTREMGKPIGAAEAEVEKCALTCDFFADHAAAFLASEPVTTEAARSYVRFDPLGVVLAVMPWNFPFWQVFRCAAPALAAGNAVALKHASNVPGCALAIEQVFREAGFPQGVFTTLMVGAGLVPGLIRHPAVRAVSLTGSEPAGAAVAALAGAALKKTVLELGGSDPFIVLADADPVAVAAPAALARTINNGQSCIAAKRFIVEEAVAPRFEQALIERMRGLVVGDPADRATQVGPLARADLLAELHGQVTRSLAAGAVLGCGGARLDRAGFFYAPTVLTQVRPGMPAFDEETFGPVAAVARARDADHAVELANLSRYGLGASVWCGDRARGEALAARLEAGAVFVNEAVRSDPRLPFGGVKRSGYGRELAAFGIREFVNVKTVWVR
ncbi:MAG: aldehyde dehydrogenase family protein [Candidatus Eisenbacteria bacterium]|nr:aldehyde dehydrogenase family protein [Candidatus Eisenbacteria bacterium]